MDPVAVGSLDFEEPDLKSFPCLRLAYEATETGGTATTALNAANEVAVASFLDRRIRFTDIPRVIEATLGQQAPRPAESLDVILAEDAAARVVARAVIETLAGKKG